MIVTVADSEQLFNKSKLITYIGTFVKLYNWKNCRQVHKTYTMVEFEKMRALMAKYLCNLGTNHIIKISSIFYSAHVISKDQERTVFYVNKYIDQDQLNQLYAFD